MPEQVETAVPVRVPECNNQCSGGYYIPYRYVYGFFGEGKITVVSVYPVPLDAGIVPGGYVQVEDVLGSLFEADGAGSLELRLGPDEGVVYTLELQIDFY